MVSLSCYSGKMTVQCLLFVDGDAGQSMTGSAWVVAPVAVSPTAQVPALPEVALSRRRPGSDLASDRLIRVAGVPGSGSGPLSFDCQGNCLQPIEHRQRSDMRSETSSGHGNRWRARALRPRSPRSVTLAVAPCPPPKSRWLPLPRTSAKPQPWARILSMGPSLKK